jgi:stage II sporulation protein D
MRKLTMWFGGVVEGYNGLMRNLSLFFIIIWIAVAGCIAGAATMGGNGFESADRLLYTGRYAKAADIYQCLSQTAQDADDRAQALLLEGTVREFFLSDPLAAIECYQKILFLYPERPAAADALFHSAVIYYNQRRLGEARASFSEYIEAYPDGVRRVSADDWIMRIKAKADEPSIRVLVADRMRQSTIRSKEKMIIQDTATGRRVCQDTAAILVVAEKGRLSVNGHETACRQLRVLPGIDVTAFNDRKSRGLYIISATDNNLQVVNQIPLEQYLYGIIPKEMPYTWSKEALMAQAVASRTYALYIREQNRDLPYDVAATVASQVYGGFDVEKLSTTLAVDATQGQVMTFGGNLIAAYYHADSGGYTEDARNVWDVEIPYLKAAPDKFSVNPSGGGWQCYLPFVRIGNLLSQVGVTVGTVRGVNILKKSPTGRVSKIEIVSDTGAMEMSGNHFRVNLGPTVIKSTRFRVVPKDDGVLLVGKGYGHGVGMSQKGASRMALMGFTYRQILEFYYPGTAISDVGIACRHS